MNNIKNRILYKKCIEVLEYTKVHSRNISPSEFYAICGKHTDKVLAELKRNKIGCYVGGYKSIWSIQNDTIENALMHYKDALTQLRKNAMNNIIAILAVFFAMISAIVGVITCSR